jgi:hypothetical protein
MGLSLTSGKKRETTKEQRDLTVLKASPRLVGFECEFF